MKEANQNTVRANHENKRQYETVDQLLSMHSSLRDRYFRRAFLLNTSLITVSIFLCVFSFVGDDLLILLGYNPMMTRFVLGLSAVMVLVISITEFRVDWKGIGSRHDEAVKLLADLKAKFRKVFVKSSGNDFESNNKLTAEYDKTMATLLPIPEKDFARLKAYHQFKRELSQRIGLNPKAPRWFLRIQLRLEGIREALKNS